MRVVRPREPLLSELQEQIVAAASLGLTNAQIAGRLKVGVSQVRYNLSRAYRKLGVHNRAGAASEYTKQLLRK